ncbi:hypothetical protein GIB67_042948 [Kingdonia uniflora]|uniref:No apical meristem-associated C-terminal domain-containing protein n=1 Tax=Kingdonia uniflora TaxID=39325 RepID=A0A7J7L634_9MAGN|nr:hypothetical protein GIB67_042948 [Kingdonia uniflora]
MDSLKEIEIFPEYNFTKVECAGSPQDSAGSESSSEQVLAAVRKGSGSGSGSNRRKLFTVQEDEQLCRSWLTIFQGWDHKLLNFWSRVAVAKRMFLKVHKKAFTLEHCWHIVRNSEKWEDFTKKPVHKIVVTPKAATPARAPAATPASPSTTLVSVKSEIGDSIAVCDPEDTRPKPEKQLRNKKRDQDEAMKRLLEQNEAVMAMLVRKEDRSTKREARRDQREQRMEDESIMRIDISDMDDIQKAYYAHRQAEIVAQLIPTDMDQT